MNLEKLQAKLLAAARKTPPSGHVPFAFEKRIMAHLAKPIADAWSLWGRALWRAAAACVFAMALLGGWSFQTASDEIPDLSQEFENTVFAALDEQSAMSVNEDAW
jgi:hypothetical protein